MINAATAAQVEAMVMPDPRFQHTAEELRHVADILDVLNAGCTAQSVGAAGGTLDIYWCESKMGVIDRGRS